MVEQRFIDYWKRQQQQHDVQQEMAKQQVWILLPVIDATLRQYGATQIFVYGSLLTDRFSERSDIDIAVGGIPSGQFYPALAAVNEHCDRWIDLKPLESLDPHFWERVQTRGIWIDEHTKPHPA
ncbi:MAG: nucleotidyltransferase domain-containing protein [Cyanobacteria bacterium J06631_12]